MSSDGHTQENSRLGIAAATAAVTVWGFGNVLAKFIPLSGPTLSFDRLWLGALLAFVLMRVMKRDLTAVDFVRAIPGGIAFGLNSLLFFTAVKYTTATTATVIGTLQPALLMLVAGRLFGEKVRAKAVVASLIALVGALVVVLGAPASGHDSLFGDLLATGALFTYAIYFVASKKARETIATIEYQVAMQVIAAIVVTPVVLVTRSSYSGGIHDWLLVLLLTIVPGGGHYLFNWAHSQTSLVLVSILTLATPIVTMGVALAMLNQGVNLAQVIGTVVVIVSLAFVVSRASSAEDRLIGT